MSRRDGKKEKVEPVSSPFALVPIQRALRIHLIFSPNGDADEALVILMELLRFFGAIPLEAPDRVDASTGETWQDVLSKFPWVHQLEVTIPEEWDESDVQNGIRRLLARKLADWYQIGTETADAEALKIFYSWSRVGLIFYQGSLEGLPALHSLPGMLLADFPFTYKPPWVGCYVQAIEGRVEVMQLPESERADFLKQAREMVAL